MKAQRPLWRDALPLFLSEAEGEPLRGDARRSRPEVVTNALRLLDGDQLTVIAYGWRNRAAGANRGDSTVHEWIRSVHRFPARAAADPQAREAVRRVLDRAETAGEGLSEGLRLLRPPRPKRPGDRSFNVPTRSEVAILADFWKEAEQAFEDALPGLSSTHPETAQARSDDQLARAAWRAFGRASEAHRRDPDGLARVAMAQTHLAGVLETLGGGRRR